MLVLRQPRALVCVASALVLTVVLCVTALSGPRATPRAAAQAADPVPLRSLLRGFNPQAHRQAGDARVAALGGGREARLTLDSALQAHVEAVLERYEVPFGALVAIEPASGRILAWVSHSSANPTSGDLALDASPPAASVFKIVTASALLDAGVSPSSRVCYGGGAHALLQADIEDNPQRDQTCGTLSEAMGSSINAIFGKLAIQHLTTASLERTARAYGFGEPLPFDVPVPPSTTEVPAADRQPLAFARVSAGFWHSHLSPFHGALIAATIARGGTMPRATLIDRITDAQGAVLYRSRPEGLRRVTSEATAARLTEMMELTVQGGTARRAFHDAQGRPYLPDVPIAGKTGTLSGSSPYRGYTWWVGFAPADEPTIALAALVVNRPEWRIKASDLARETLEHFLIDQPRREAPASH